MANVSVPASRDVGSCVKNHGSLIQGVCRIVLDNRTHYPPDKLNKWAKLTEHAENGSHGEIPVIEAFTKLTHLDYHVQLVVIEPLQNTFIGRAVLPAVNIVCPSTTSAIRFNDLNAMLIIQRGSDDLQALLSGRCSKPIQLTDGCIDNRV
jgi:hypothetical protein